MIAAVETFLPIHEYEDYYLIGNLGTVKSLGRIINMPYGGTRIIEPQILKPNIVQGYAQVILQIGGVCLTFKVHRLVGVHFIPNPNNHPQINHIDTNKLNNVFWNLEWCTAKHNMRHAVAMGLRPTKKGIEHPIAKQVLNTETGKVHETVWQAAQEEKVHVATLSHFLNKTPNRPISVRLQNQLRKFVFHSL